MKTLKILSDYSGIEKARQFLKKSLEELKISEEDSFQIELSLVEVCNNIVMYAYPQKKGEIVIGLFEEEGKIFLEIRDRGIPFDPTKAKTPDLEEFLRTGKKGGLGILLYRKLMDGFDYKREDAENVLTMWKTLKKTEPLRF